MIDGPSIKRLRIALRNGTPFWQAVMRQFGWMRAEDYWKVLKDWDATIERWRQTMEERDALRERLESIQSNRPYPDCDGDCGVNRMYCCDGLWDRR